MKMAQIVKKLKIGKNCKKISKKANTKYSLTKRKNQKCSKLKKETILTKFDPTENNLRRKTMNDDS